MTEKDQGKQDLIFTPENPSILTTLLAVYVIGGQALISQKIDNSEVYSIVSVDTGWIPQRLDKKDMINAIKIGNGNMVPVERETGEPIEFSSTAELIADLQQKFDDYWKQQLKPISKEDVERIRKMKANMEAGKENLLEGL